MAGKPGYPAEFRAEAVALYRSSGRSMREVAQDLGVSNESMRRWVQQADIDEGRRDGLNTEERREIRELCRKVRTLEQEREAAAFFARENETESGRLTSCHFRIWAQKDSTIALERAVNYA